jgi:hypothetical protein
MRRTVFLGGLLALALTSPASAGTLRAGVGRADITPPTGYYMMGWVRSDAKPIGVWTRLYARVAVLERDGHKVALVSEDLGAIPGGMLKQAAELNADRGFSERNVLDSASHTHAGPTGFYNFSTYNTVFMSTSTLTDFNVAGTLDPQLYAFMVRRLALAIRRADDDLGPAVAGWGKGQILGLTANRSIEAHLADHGILKDFGTGSVRDDPDGYAHTIDPEVHVLRVDKLIRRRRVPAAIWSTFSNHGTTVRASFLYYGADHHASATRVVEDALRAAGRRAVRRVRPRPMLPNAVNVYGNTDEGDVSSGLVNDGPAWADEVGRMEAAAMLRAWRDAGKSLSNAPALDSRWTRVCFCGQETEGGRVDSKPVVGLPLFTGSEEGRGPLYDNTRTPFEGDRSPVDQGEQGHKLGAAFDTGGTSTPHAVPLMALRIGDRMVVSVPGEMTAEMGRRVRAAVLSATSSAGIRVPVISGLANEYLQYFTTPEEYERQHYEGGSTLYGKLSSNLIRQSLVDLAGRLARGAAAAAPYAYDPTNGVKPESPPFPAGASSASAIEQPAASARRLQHPAFSWQGGERGFDRPLDRPFVSLQRLTRRTWRTQDSDLATRVLWSVDDAGRYRARWEPSFFAPAGRYRFLVTGNRYSLASRTFFLRPSRLLSIRRVDAPAGQVAVALDYPIAFRELDWTWRPRSASGGVVTFTVNGRPVTVRRRAGTRFAVKAPAGARVEVAAGAASDRYGNVNAAALGQP